MKRPAQLLVLTLALSAVTALAHQEETKPQETAKPAKSIPMVKIGTPTPVAPEKDLPPAPSLLTAGQALPAFTIEGPDGKPFSSKALAGKVVVLDFWATWCGPCKASFPHLEEIWQKLKTHPDATVLALCTSDEREKFRAYVKENKDKFTFPVAYDPAGRDNKTKLSRNKFGVTAIPTTFVIGKDGKIVATIVGYNPDGHALEDALLKAGIELSTKDH